MTFSLRSFLIAIGCVAFLLALSIPIYNALVFDPIEFAKQRLKSKNARIIVLRDKMGESIALIDLSSQKISNDDLRYITTLNPSAEIDLSGTAIDDDGLNYLAGLSALRIDLSGTLVSLDGVNKLKKTLSSETEVVFDGK